MPTPSVPETSTGCLIALERHFDQRAEAADAGEHLAAHRAFGDGLDAFDELVARVDVDAGIAIGESGFSHVREVRCRRGGSGKNVRYCSQCAHSCSDSSRWRCSRARRTRRRCARCASSKSRSPPRRIRPSRPRPPCGRFWSAPRARATPRTTPRSPVCSRRHSNT